MFRIDEGGAVGSLHPFVHSADESVNSILSDIERKDSERVERVGYDKSVMFVCDLCDLSDPLSATVGPGYIVNGDYRSIIVNGLLPLFKRNSSVIITV